MCWLNDFILSYYNTSGWITTKKKKDINSSIRSSEAKHRTSWITCYIWKMSRNTDHLQNISKNKIHYRSQNYTHNCVTNNSLEIQQYKSLFSGNIAMIIISPCQTAELFCSNKQVPHKTHSDSQQIQFFLLAHKNLPNALLYTTFILTTTTFMFIPCILIN